MKKARTRILGFLAVCLVASFAYGDVGGGSGKWFESSDCSGSSTAFESAIPSEASSYYTDDNPETCIEVMTVTAQQIDWGEEEPPEEDEMWYWCTGIDDIGAFGGCVCPASLTFVMFGMGPGYVEGIVREDAHNSGCIHGRRVSERSFEYVWDLMRSDEFDWTNYSIGENNCQDWADAVRRKAGVW